MSFWKKTMIWLGLEEEVPGEHGADAVHVAGPVAEGMEVSGQRVGPEPFPPSGYQEVGDSHQAAPVEDGGEGAYPAGVSSSYIPSGAEAAGFEAGSGVRMLPATETRVHVVEPVGFADAQEIGEHFRQSQPVIVDLEDVERDTARRIVDFSSGLTFALRGRMKKIGDHVFLLLPAHASIPDHEKERLRASGYEI